MRLPAIFLFNACLVLTAFGQDKFAQGFYVTNEGDTVKGYIQYKESYYHGFVFRQQLKSSSIRFTIEQVKTFGFTFGNFYKRIEFSEKKDIPLTPIFVKVVVEGEVDLFVYDGNFLIGSEKLGRFRLAKGKASSEGEGIKSYQKNTGIFNMVFQDCPLVKEKAQKIPVSEGSLIGLLKEYHACRGMSYHEFHAEKTKHPNRFGFFAGESISSLSFGKPATFINESYLYNSDFGTSAKPSFGLIALFSGRKPSSIVAIQSELVYTKASFSGTWAYEDNDLAGYSIKQTSITTIDYSRLSLFGGLRLTGRSNQLNPYGSFGLSYHSFLSMKSNVNQTTEINSSVEVKNFEVLSSNGSVGFWVGGGLKKKISGRSALFLDVNYEYSPISNSGRVTVLTSRIGFLF